MNYIFEYNELIQSGKIITSRRVKNVYKNICDDLNNPNSKYYFDEIAANRIIEFAETYCKQSQGTLGAPIKLELFQKAFLQCLFGILTKDEQIRRFNETLFLVGRKNGKTTLLSIVALYLLIADHEGAAEIYSVATKKEQAAKCLTEAVNMVKQSPELASVLKKRRTDLYFPATSSKFEALASDSNTLDGLNSHGVIIDELHAIRDRNLYEVMKQSMSSREQPMLVMITTAGTGRECIFDDKYEYACNIADGIIFDDNFLAILYELDSRDEWNQPDCWIKANPGLGTIKKIKTLARFVEAARNDPKELPGVLCKDFNIKQNHSNAWLEEAEIINPATFDMKLLENSIALGGVDLSDTTDLTCATLLIMKKGDRKKYIIQKYFMPKEQLEKRVREDQVEYKEWAKMGFMEISEGWENDYKKVKMNYFLI